jgi:hypothetical protein
MSKITAADIYVGMKFSCRHDTSLRTLVRDQDGSYRVINARGDETNSFSTLGSMVMWFNGAEPLYSLPPAQTQTVDAALFIKRHAGDSIHHYRQEVALEMLTRRDGESYLRHVIKRAGIELGLHIGEKLQAEYKGIRPGAVVPYDPQRDIARYEAEVFVFTPAELKKLVEAAIKAGRGS